MDLCIYEDPVCDKPWFCTSYSKQATKKTQFTTKLPKAKGGNYKPKHVKDIVSD